MQKRLLGTMIFVLFFFTGCTQHMAQVTSPCEKKVAPYSLEYIDKHYHCKQ